MDRDRSFPGGVAQLVERHVRNVEVGGSSPLTSTANTALRILAGSFIAEVPQNVAKVLQA